MLSTDPRRLAPALWILLGLFVLRVAGQVLVAFLDVRWLPPMEQWYSGLAPYPLLLPAQLVIILIYGKVCVDFSRGAGWFVRTRPWFGRGVLWCGYLYLGVMIARYPVQMALSPEDRWFGHTIPIMFHWVLAAFIILFGRFHRRRLQERAHFRSGT
ncbi:MAG: hypothetical protein GEV06_25815 [Luteitalea sp.]|nr:hypothetical protein [Luteitalea sp.]